MTKPLAKSVTYWRLRSWPIERAVEGSVNRIDYSRDSDPVTAGVQNTSHVTGVEHDPSSEDVVIHVVSVSVSGAYRKPRWRNMPDTGTIADAGGINASVQTINVTSSDSGWAVGETALIGSEIVTIAALTPGTPNQWTVVRGDHGTEAASHANGAAVQRLIPNCATYVKTLDAVLSGISAPSSLVAQQQPNSILLTWDDNLDADERKLLSNFVLAWDTSSHPDPDPPPYDFDADPYANVFEIGVDAQYVFFPATTDAHYFRVAARMVDGNLTAWSEEANATKGITDLLDPSKPDPPAINLAPLGGSNDSGWVMLVSVDAVPSSPGLNAIEKAQFQIGPPAATFDSGTGLSTVVKYADGSTDADEVLGKPPHKVERTLLKSTQQLGGPYQMTARLYNSAGDVWSDWADPVQAVTIEGQPDDSPPVDLTGAAFQVQEYDGTKNLLGHAVQIYVEPPTEDSLSIDAIEIQASSTLWSANLDDTVNLTIGVSGTGTVTAGGSVLTVTSSAPATPFTPNAYAGQFLVIADSYDTATGEIDRPQAFRIVSNDETTFTVQSFTATAFDRSGSVEFGVGTLKFTDAHHRFYPVSDIRNGLIRPIVISASAYWRGRWRNRQGVGRWHYHDNTTDRLSASLFNPLGIKTGAIEDDAITTAKIVDSAVIASKLSESSRQVRISGTFSAVDNNTVSWSGIAIGFPGEPDSNPANGNTGNMASPTYIYWDAASPTTLQTTTSIATATGERKVVVCYAEPQAAGIEAAFFPIIWSLGSKINAERITTLYLSSLNNVLGTVTVLAGQDITLTESDSDPSEIKWGSAVSIYKGVTADDFHIADVGGGNSALFFDSWGLVSATVKQGTGTYDFSVPGTVTNSLIHSEAGHVALRAGADTLGANKGCSVELFGGNGAGGGPTAAQMDFRVGSGVTKTLVLSLTPTALNLAGTVTVTGAFNATASISLNGANINTNGTLTNVAYLGQANTFTADQTVRGDLYVRESGSPYDILVAMGATATDDGVLTIRQNGSIVTRLTGENAVPNYINNNGGLGLGKTNPSGWLDVNGDIWARASIALASATASGGFLRFNTATTPDTIEFQSNSGNDIQIIAANDLYLSNGVVEMSFGTSINATGTFAPLSDNTYNCGTASRRWADVRSVKINGADIGLANGWKLREWPAREGDIGNPESWMKENAALGVQVIDGGGRIMFVLHADGNIYARGGVRSIEEVMHEIG